MIHSDMMENIVYLIGNLFRIYIISVFMCGFFEREVPFRRRVLRSLCYMLYFCVNSICFLWFDCAPMVILATNIVGSLALTMTYKGTWKYRIYAVVTTVVTYIICENLIYSVLINLNARHIVVIGIIISDLFFLVIVLIVRKIIDLKNGEEIAFIEWCALLFIPIFSLIISIIVSYTCRNELAVAAVGIGMLLMNILIFYLMECLQNMYNKQLDLKLLEQQNQAYENQMLLSKQSNKKITSLRHDMKNHFLILQQLAQENDCDEIRRYLWGLSEEMEVKKNIICTGNPIIDSFLNIKLGKAIEEGVEVKTDLSIPKNIAINNKDITIILGNLLDNALRALESCSDKKCLYIAMEQKPGVLIIRIKNSYSNEIKMKGNAFLTTKMKETGHGIGLKNVQRVVEAYQGYMKVEYKECIFSVKIAMYFM